MATSNTKFAIFAALAGNSLIAVTKFAASMYTGSSAMLSEAIHSVVDTGNQILLLYGLKRAEKQADELHPFGYGRELYFWSFVVAIMIFGLGAGLSLYEGIERVRHPEEIKSPLVNFVVLGLSILFEGAATTFAFKEFNKARGDLGLLAAIRQSKNPALFTVLFEDSAAVTGLLVAMAGLGCAYYFDLPWMDGAASIGIAVVLAVTAAMLAYETKALLIGEAASDQLQAGVRDIVKQAKMVRHINELRTMHLGPNEVLLALSLDFRNDISAGVVERVIYDIEKTIKQQFPEIGRLFIEVQSRKHHTEDTTHPQE